ELQLVAPRQIGGPVGEGVAVLFVCELQRRTHPLPRLDVPDASRGAGEARALPEELLALVRARLIAARHEQGAPLGDPPQRRDGVAQAAQPRRIARRADDKEFVVHHQAAAHEVDAIDHRACICTMTRLLLTPGPCSSNAVYSSCSFKSSPEKKYCAPPV